MAELEVEYEETVTRTEKAHVCDACGGDVNSKGVAYFPVALDDVEPKKKIDSTVVVGDRVDLCTDCVKDGTGPSLREVRTAATYYVFPELYHSVKTKDAVIITFALFAFFTAASLISSNFQLTWAIISSFCAGIAILMFTTMVKRYKIYG